jgi:membrane fusion protein (multidrug efflux system)
LRYSEVRSAEAKVEVAKSDLERAERYYRRLSAADNRGITATEMDNAEMALSAAKATLNSAVAAVEQAKASAAIAEFNLKHTKVFSPISGRIGKALHHVGDYVSPSKSALAHVVKLDPIRVVFPITDRDYDAWQSAAERRGTQLNASRRFRIRLPNGEEYAERGTIEFGDNEMSRETGTLVMYVSFPNPSGRLVPNAFVRVLSDEANPPRVLAVPSGAVVLSDDGARVWTVDGENKARSVSVEIGKTWNGVTLVKSGLSEGDKIVSSGAFKLKEGASLVCHEGNEVR